MLAVILENPNPLRQISLLLHEILLEQVYIPVRVAQRLDVVVRRVVLNANK